MRRTAFAVGLLTVATVSGQTPCDRACLTRTVDSYFTALVAHDPSRVAIARNAKFTENTNVIRPGDGLWKTIREGPTKFKIYVPDPVSRQVGFVGVITESGGFLPDGRFQEAGTGIYPVFLALRLKVEGREIAESEALVYRSVGDPRFVCAAPLPQILCERANLETVRPGLRATVPPAGRASREELLRIADGYYESIVRSDGNAASFADDCVRIENGTQTSLRSPEQVSVGRGLPIWVRFEGLSCRDQMNTRALGYITSISRRVQIADPETGLVFGLSMFRRPYLEPVRKILNIPGVESIDESKASPSNRLWAHVFKVSGGRIHEIEAMSGVFLPLDSKHGWETD